MFTHTTLVTLLIIPPLSTTPSAPTTTMSIFSMIYLQYTSKTGYGTCEISHAQYMYVRWTYVHQLMLGKSFRIEERLKMQSGEENSSSSSDEEFSSPDCVFKRFSIRKNFPDISWKFRSPKSLFYTYTR